MLMGIRTWMPLALCFMMCIRVCCVWLKTVVFDYFFVPVAAILYFLSNVSKFTWTIPNLLLYRKPIQSCPKATTSSMLLSLHRPELPVSLGQIIFKILDSLCVFYLSVATYFIFEGGSVFADNNVWLSIILSRSISRSYKPSGYMIQPYLFFRTFLIWSLQVKNLTHWTDHIL